MKKTYINPELEVVKMVINHQLLDGSVNAQVDNTELDNNDALGHGTSYDW